MSPQTAVVSDQDLCAAVFERIAADLGMILDREISVGEVQSERAATRAAGRDQVHISFRLGIRHGGRGNQGCVLVPLPDAIGLASLLMMVPDEEVEASRRATTLDRPAKDALLEIGNFISGATDAAIHNWFPDGCFVHPEGCQGVRPDVRPAFDYAEGDELVVARAEITVAGFPPFEAVLMLPGLAASPGFRHSSGAPVVSSSTSSP